MSGPVTSPPALRLRLIDGADQAGGHSAGPTPYRWQLGSAELYLPVK